MLGVRLARIPAVNGAATRSGFAATFQRRRTISEFCDASAVIRISGSGGP